MHHFHPVVVVMVTMLIWEPVVEFFWRVYSGTDMYSETTTELCSVEKRSGIPITSNYEFQSGAKGSALVLVKITCVSPVIHMALWDSLITQAPCVSGAIPIRTLSVKWQSWPRGCKSWPRAVAVHFESRMVIQWKEQQDRILDKAILSHRQFEKDKRRWRKRIANRCRAGRTAAASAASTGRIRLRQMKKGGQRQGCLNLG